ncbi:hypothetical protein IV500_15965 [Paeniglutamicibacter antarcticus]|uniref:DUF6457 domain-containing protein n=1 Tax=Arthrobacter terrae TaxID=2935737 RepID=A0A931CLP2_9MICC|nr:DUF6457 domain-containing protein [Arthrobacter terrae]MBG0740872.1 hypothetical protein [Arthrobacter terrae]
MTDHDEEERDVTQWGQRLSQALQILDLQVDQKLILKLADESTRSAGPSAAPISTFLVGYAAALAVSSGHVGSQAAVRSAVDTALQLCGNGKTGGPDTQGWAGTAQ